MDLHIPLRRLTLVAVLAAGSLGVTAAPSFGEAVPLPQSKPTLDIPRSCTALRDNGDGTYTAVTVRNGGTLGPYVCRDGFFVLSSEALA
jgi:hypothetical protein